jgi:hypothetical protein
MFLVVRKISSLESASNFQDAILNDGTQLEQFVFATNDGCCARQLFDFICKSSALNAFDESFESIA